MQTEWEQGPPLRSGNGGKPVWPLIVVLGLVGVLGLGVFVLLGDAFYTGFSHSFNDGRYHACRARGDDDYSRGDYGLAADDYSQMIALRPQAPNGYRLRGDAYDELDRYTAAIGDYTVALRLAENTDARYRFNLYYNRGDAYDDRQDYGPAIADYTTALHLMPGDPDTLRARCGAYRDAHDYAHALQDADALIAPRPMDGAGYLLRADVRQAAGDHARAAADYRTAMRLSPDAMNAYDALAQMYDDDGKDAEAAQVTLAEARAHPDNAACWGNLGWWQYKAGDYQACLASSRRSVGLDSHQMSVWLNIGLCYAVENNGPMAERTYANVLPSCQPADVQAGLEDLRNAAKRQPHNAAIPQAIALLGQGGA